MNISNDYKFYFASRPLLVFSFSRNNLKSSAVPSAVLLSFTDYP